MGQKADDDSPLTVLVHPSCFYAVTEETDCITHCSKNIKKESPANGRTFGNKCIGTR